MDCCRCKCKWNESENGKGYLNFLSLFTSRTFFNVNSVCNYTELENTHISLNILNNLQHVSFVKKSKLIIKDENAIPELNRKQANRSWQIMHMLFSSKSIKCQKKQQQHSERMIFKFLIKTKLRKNVFYVTQWALYERRMLEGKITFSLMAHACIFLSQRLHQKSI